MNARAKRFFPVLVLAALLAAVLAAGFLFERGQDAGADPKLAAYADRIIAACAKEAYPPSCYDTEIPKIMDEGVSMEDAFAVTRIIQDRQSGYFYCHVLGHNLSAKETAKDPSKWTEVVARCPSGMCSNGCLHGAAQERFRDDTLTTAQVEALIPELSGICEPSGARAFTGVEQASCYHSLGHLAMYITGADVREATAVCDRVAKHGDRDFTRTCYEGAYMQIFQPLEPEDFALVKDIAPEDAGKAEAFCDSFAGEYRAACHRESWPLYREHLAEPGTLERFCALAPGADNEQRCYTAMFYVLTAQFHFDAAKVTSLCESLPEAREAQCFGNAASRTLETDYRLIPEAVALCAKAAERGVGDRCYQELLFYSSYNFAEGSSEFKRLCAALPAPYADACRSGEGKNIRPSQLDPK